MPMPAKLAGNQIQINYSNEKMNAGSLCEARLPELLWITHFA